MIKKKQIPQWKLDEINELIDLFEKYKNIGIIEVGRIQDIQFQSTRKILRDKAIFKMSKRSLQLRAIEEFEKKSKKSNLDKLADNIPGQSSLVFTNLDFMELKQVFTDNAWMVPAKPDEITAVDIWVPAGDTGLPTGQVISELNMTLKLPTRIMNDTIHIREDTRTHKVGDLVTVKQAAVLKKLGITPIKSMIKISYAWNDGEIMPIDVLYMDIEVFKQNVMKAYQEAVVIAFKMPFYIEGIAEAYLRKAISEANTLEAVIFGGGISVPTEATPQVEEKEAKEEEPEEEVGIGGLFG